ncbi:MAG: hypothetical protein HeimC3_51950 [Candidatus Heimdallarchaeota archaeon LC_3]|nr:MAG: hypothetical protein HeimC3_51950 [Candidatus Heimdallarchaeota archaeon LC_3]
MLINSKLSTSEIKNINETIMLALNRDYLLTLKELNKYLIGYNNVKITEQLLLKTLPYLKIRNNLIIPDNLEKKETLIKKSVERKLNHRISKSKANLIAIQFVQEFLQFCPFVKCILLSGSLATGGYQSEDDIDFNVFCRTGTKYITWLIAILLGIKYSIIFKKRSATLTARTGLPVEKLICVNVVWWESQSLPFSRQDMSMGFELVLSKVLYNPDQYFDKILEKNGFWLKEMFPQLYRRQKSGLPKAKRLNLIGKLLKILGNNHFSKRFLEILAYKFSWLLFNFVHWKRRKNTIAKTHYKKIAQLKFPYEVFQDITL